MNFTTSIPQRPFGRAIAATVGSYDGVHAGHRVLLAHTRAEAERLEGESMVITFDPHPRLALDPECDMRLLSSTKEKELLLAREGIDHLLVIPFDREFSRLDPAEFLRLLVERVGVRSLVVGYDHRFGRDKSGGRDLLEALKEELGLEVVEVPEQEMESEHVSSTVVRRLIQEGDVAHAARLLGHNYLMHATISREGEVRPTERHKLLPPQGEYRIRIEGEEHRMQISEEKIYLFDFKGDNKDYIIEFIQ